MLSEKTRKTGFWLLFTIILVFPLLLGFLYYTDIHENNVSDIRMKQDEINTSLHSLILNELQQLCNTLSASEHFLRYRGLGPAQLAATVQTYPGSTAPISAVAHIRDARFLYVQEYQDYALDAEIRRQLLSISNLAKPVEFRLFQGEGEQFRLAVLRQWDYGSYYAVFVDLGYFHNIARDRVDLPERSQVFLVTDDGIIINNTFAQALNGRNFTLYLDRLKINAAQFGAAIKTAGFYLGAAFFPEKQDSERVIISTKPVWWNESKTTMLLISPFSSMIHYTHQTARSILLMLSLLFSILLFQGIVYAKMRKKAVLASKKASKIPSLEETIKRSELAKLRYHQLFDSIMDGIVVTDMDNRIIECNHSFADMLGYVSAELNGINQQTITPPKYWSEEETRLKEHLPAWGFSRDYEKEYMRRDGSMLPVILNSTLVTEEETGNKVILSTVKDISAQKRTDNEIKRLHRHLQDIIESSPSVFITIDKDHHITSFNSSAEKFFDLKRSDVLDTLLEKSIPFFKKYRACLNTVMEKKETISMNSETCHVRENDSYVNLNFYPLISGESIAVHLQDITENIKLETQLFQSQKMEAMGTLASGFAHDFNNILTGMFSYISFLKLKITDDELLEKVNTLNGITRRAASLVQHILAFSRKSEIFTQPVRVYDVCQEVEAILSRSLPKNIRLINKVTDKECHVKGDPSQISQIILNLCLNARDAMLKGGDLEVELEKVNIREQDVMRFRNLSSGEVAKITISDTGTGIPSDIQDKIFDPFFTTKVKGKGTGLGLSIVYGILRNHHGDITITSLPNQGTRVSVYLPITGEKSPTAEEERVLQNFSPLQELSGKGTILVIDDEQVLLDALEDGFQRVGYEVYTATGGEKGIALYKEHNIDLVVLDMIMPGLSGEETFDALKKQDPGIKIIIHTGYTRPEIQQKMVKKGALKVIHKPYDIYELIRMVNTILAETTPSEEAP